VSDFLARLTARHADAAASPIVPRVSSRFEAVAAPTLDVVDQEVPASIRHTANAEEALVAEPRVTREIVDRSTSIAGDREPRAAADPAPVKPGLPTPVRIEQILKQVDTIVNAPQSSDARHEPGTQPRMVATPLVPRIVPPRAAHQVLAGRSAVAHESVDESEPTVIRVHIGRIDVRASMPAAERPRVRAAKAGEQAKPMSLDRYLSGKDRA
jgi:hypothetical protein